MPKRLLVGCLLMLSTLVPGFDLAADEPPPLSLTSLYHPEQKFDYDGSLPKTHWIGNVDSRLLVSIAPAVAKAAMASGVATKPIADLEAYRADLARFVNRSAPLMRPVVATTPLPRDSRDRLFANP